jgi:8-oxo-dGTP pyrophosphatase MutT (NUDIX family)
MTSFKQPVSVLVVIYTPALDVLLLERSAHPGFWQSVTGSREGDEGLADTARREVGEETGLDGTRYHWRFVGADDKVLSHGSGNCRPTGSRPYRPATAPADVPGWRDPERFGDGDSGN